jgi:hypothetical protein
MPLEPTETVHIERLATSPSNAKESIMIALPNLRWVASSLAASMVSLERASHAPGSRYRFQFLWVTGARPCDYARNLCVKVFLESDCSRLWFMDSDTMPPPNFTRLLLIDADIVSGVTPTWGNNQSDEPPSPNLTVFRYDPELRGLLHSEFYQDGVEEVDAVGTAMMIIKRRVLEDMRMRLSPEYTAFDGLDSRLGGGDPPAVFREVRKPNGAMNMTEDCDFCLRAKKLGYTIKVDHGIKCGHWKEVDVLQVIDYTLAKLDEAPARQGEPEALESLIDA